MKNLFLTLFLLVVLAFFGTFVFIRVSQAQNSITSELLDLPAPPPPNPLIENVFRKRADDFYKKTNAPKDDAPIENLLDYWKTQNEAFKKLGYNTQMSEKNLERIIAEIEKKPESLVNFLNVLPDNPEAASFVKQIYDREVSGENFEKYQSEQVKQWLTYHSNYYSDDLLKKARQVGDTGEYVSNQDELLALAKVDWEKASAIVERLYNDKNQPVSQVLASWVLYEHALDTDSASDIERYRAELKATVENKSATDGMRDLAMDALSHTPDFTGRDDWYFSLLGDETLADLQVNGQSYTGLTTLMLYSPPEKYVEKLIELLKSDNQTVRNAAVRNLGTFLDEKNPEVIKALLPWLENPNWAKASGSERRQLVMALRNLAMPESVPGLIAVLNEKETRNFSNSMNSNMAPAVRMESNMMNSNVMIDFASKEDSYPLRNDAILALATQKDMRAVPALRLVMPEIEVWQRGNVVRALLASGGFTVSEQIEAIETIAKSINLAETNRVTNANMSSNMSNVMVEDSPITVTTNVANGYVTGRDHLMSLTFNPSDLKFMLANQLISAPEVSDEFIAALVDRINELDTKDRPLALVLRKIIQKWQNTAVNTLLLKDLKNGKADVDGIVKLLSLRKDLREKQPNEVYDLRSGGNPAALGIASCLLENNNDYDAILAGNNAEIKTAMLGCARLIRAQLPVRKVAENLTSSDKLLALAAERYLESEDSPEAQALVFAQHPNEAKILGATVAFMPDEKSGAVSNFLDDLFASVNPAFSFSQYYLLYSYSDKSKQIEKKLQNEVKDNQELLGVYSYDGNFIRIYQNKAVFSWEEDAARYNERTLTGAEFNNIKDYLTSQRVNELAPFLSFCEGCEGKELLMLGRGGGRRIFMHGDRPAEFFANLDRIFTEMRQPPAKLHYRLEKDIAGLEILFADKNLQARTVWKNGDDFRVLLDDTERRKQIDKQLEEQEEAAAENEETDYEKAEELNIKRRARREFENFAWYRIGKNNVEGLAAQPPQVEYLPVRDGSAVTATNEQWKARTANFEIRTDDEGIYKKSGGRTTKIQSGFYAEPVVTPNGRWAVATKYSEEDNLVLARINLLTNKEFKIKLKNYPRLNAVAFIPSVNKVLIRAGTYNYDYEDEDSVKSGDYFLLDAETGVMQPVKGEVRPLAQQTFRPLQANAAADEFWAAIPDKDKKQTEVGIYNAKTLTFKPLLKIPQILFDSMDLWVDEKENKIYFTYQGQLLGLPLAAETKR